METRRHAASSTADDDRDLHGGKGSGIWARIANVVLGSWLFASAFVLPQTDASGANTWVTGMLFVIFGVWSLWAPPVRTLNLAAAIWLLFTVAVFPYATLTVRLHNLLIAGAVLGISLVRNRPLRMRAYI